MENDVIQEIEGLKIKLEQVRAQFHLLLSQEDPVSVKYIAEIERATQEREKDAKKALEDGNKLAKKALESVKLQMKDDHEMATLNITERLNDLLRYKFTAISENFPEACKYFRNQNSRFLHDILKEKLTNPNFDSYTIELSTEPVFQEEDIKKVLEQQNIKKIYVKDSTLYKGNKQFTIGTNVIWTIPTNPHFNVLCTIRDINSRYIELNIDNSTTKRIKIESLKSKICKLKRA